MDLINAILSGATGATIGSVATALFLNSYLAKKAENLATKEDIGLITDLIEAAKAPHTEKIEGIKASYQLRMAVLEKRMAAHQEAFTLWMRMRENVFTDERSQVVEECVTWWRTNCLYLEESVRIRFTEAYWALEMHSELLKDSDRSPESIRMLGTNFTKIMSLGDVITKAVGLPPLVAVERKGVDEAAITGKPT